MDDSLNNFLAEQQQQQQSRLNLNCSSIETDLSLFHMNIRSISNKLKLVITKCYGVRATTIEGDQITSDSPNERDQIAFCAFHSFLVEVQTFMRRMRHNNLEIRIAGSSRRPQLK